MINFDPDVAMDLVFRTIIVFAILAGTVLLVRILRNIVDKTGKTVKGSTLRFYSRLFFGVVYFLGVLLAISVIPPLRNLSMSIFAGSSVLAIVIGFAAQHSIANIVSGCFITMFKPFQIGDRVKFIGKDITGMVEDITLRHTVIKTFENKRVVVPNSVVSVDVIENSNIVEEKVCRFFEIGISYDSDHVKAMRIIAEEVEQHPDFFDNRSEEEKSKGADPVKVRILGFGDSSVKLRAWVWAKDNPTGFNMICDLNRSVKERFDKEGVEIPFPHRTLVHKERK